MPDLRTVKDRVAKADAANGGGLRMTKKVDAAVKQMVTKKVNPRQQWQVVLLADRSGSMGNEYRNGSVQDAVERALGFAVIVDDDGSVPTIFFDHRLQQVDVSLDNYSDLIRRERIDAYGSTGLTEALVRAAEITGNGDLFSGGGFFKRGASSPTKKKADIPVFLFVVTDGVPNDPQSAADAIRKLSYRGVFIKFLYVGNDRSGWQFLESLDDDIPVGVPYEQGGRLVDNVDAKQMADLRSASDDTFYEAMLDEVPTYLTTARQNELLA